MRLSLLKAILGTILTMIALTGAAPALATPDLSLEGIDGKSHRLSEYIGKGKWTAVNIWGTKCPPCREEMPELVHFHDEHESNNATVLGIAIDFPSFQYAKKDEVIAFTEDYLVSFPVLLSDSSITLQLGAGSLEGLPSTYMFTPEGKLVGYQVGAINRQIIENFIKQYETRQAEGKNKQ